MWLQRPVSLTCIASKLTEHILVSSMMKHAQSQIIIHHLQHGFRFQFSCETQLIQFINDLVTYMQSGTQTDLQTPSLWHLGEDKFVNQIEIKQNPKSGDRG